MSNRKTFRSAFTKGHRLITMLKAEKLASGKQMCHIPAIGSTRFNSVYHSIAAVLEMRCDIVMILDRCYVPNNSTFPSKRVIYLAKDKKFWKRMEKIKDLSEPLYKVNDAVQGTKTRLSDVVAELVSALVQVHFRSCAAFMDSYKSIIGQLIDFILDPICMLTTYMDPRYKFDFTEIDFQRIETGLGCCIACFKPEFATETQKDFEEFQRNRNSIKPNYFDIDLKKSGTAQARPLSALAKRLFSIVPHSMSCERLFCSMGWINKPPRASMTTEHIVRAAKVYFMMRQTQNLNKNCHESYLQEFTTSSSDIEIGVQSIDEVPILYNSPISNSEKEIEEIRE